MADEASGDPNAMFKDTALMCLIHIDSSLFKTVCVMWAGVQVRALLK